MPLTRLANTALDIVGEKRDEVVAEIAGYGETDLVCYRVDRPEELRRRQQAAWDPLVQWIADEYGARLEVTTAVVPTPQPREAVDALCRAVTGFDDFVLAAFQRATGALGSIVLALAMTAGRIGGRGGLGRVADRRELPGRSLGRGRRTPGRRARSCAASSTPPAGFIALCRPASSS